MDNFKDVDIGELGRNLFARLLRATSSDGSFEDLMAYCSKKNSKYTDDSFPPNPKSLINDWNHESDDIQEKVDEWRTFEWVRATEIPELNDEEGKLAVFQNDVTPSDIKQGLLGDCYFLSILSVLAEKPDRITKLFLTDRMNEFGLFAVILKKNGEAREVVIDDFFPCQDGEPCFSRANGNELWVLILEKAWAKLHGSYERIEAGFAHNVMTDLTGAPAFDLGIEEEGEDVIWEKLVAGEKKNYLMAASAGSTEASAEVLEELGLVAQHSYGLLKAVEVTNEDDEKIRLVMLRNPWGDFEWNGDWSDKSDLWTDDIKEQCGYNDDVGLFWMSYSDICHYFSRIQVCHMNDDYSYSFMKANHMADSYSLMRLKVSGDGEHTITVNQTDERCFSRDSSYDYSYCRMAIFKIEEDADSIDELKINYIKGVSGWDRETHAMFDNLEHGDYYVFVEMDWGKSTEETEFCVSCYGASKSFFLRDEKSLYDKHALLRKAYEAKCANASAFEGIQITNYDAKGAPMIKKMKEFTEEGYGFIHIANEEKEAVFKEVVTFKNFQGLTLCKPQQGQQYDIKVKPGSTKTILLKCDPEGYAMSSATSTKIEFGGKKLRQMCKETGKKVQRADPESGEPKEIYQYSLQHSSGICYLYVNESENETLEEEIEFTLTGLEIEGQPSGATTVEIKVEPGKEKFIQLKSIAQPWKIAMAVSYGIY